MKKCKRCNKIMIRRYEPYTFLTYPFELKNAWWCGLCDIYESAQTLTGLSEEEIAIQDWREVNKLPQVLSWEVTEDE
jgi:hypothetical protein